MGGRKMRASGRAVTVAMLLLASAVFPWTVSAGQVTVTWTFSTNSADGTPLTDLAGARVYYGTASSNYTEVLDLPGGQPGQTCRFTITGLVEGVRYYLNGTSYGRSGGESDFCAEVTKIATNQDAGALLKVSAGPDGTAQNHVGYALHGEVTDAALAEGQTLVVTWSKVDGPGVVTFENSHAADTTVFFDRVGRYTLRLAATDGVNAGSDEAVFEVGLQAPKNLRIAH